MTDVLLIIANKRNVDIYQTKTPFRVIVKLETIFNPNTRRSRKDFLSNRIGLVFKSNSFGSRKLLKENKGLGYMEKSYCKHISVQVKAYLEEFRGIKVVLVAESGFLGTLKNYFKNQQIHLNGAITKELSHQQTTELLENVRNDLMFL